MAASSAANPWEIIYPTFNDSREGQTDDHRDNMVDLIETLKSRYAQEEPPVYVSANLFVYYEPGNRLRHLAPDVFVVRGVPNHRRDYFLIWEEGKGPEVVIELTSRSTKGEDVDDKFWLYRDVLKVPEYFLFDPHQEYLTPPLQGFRLISGEYVPIETVEGRLASDVLGLQLEQHEGQLRLYDPASRRRLSTPREALLQTQAALDQAVAGKREAERELSRIRAELDRLREK